MKREESYRHTQTAPLGLILLGSGFVCFALGWVVEEPGNLVALPVGAVLAFVGLCFHHLTVADEGEALAIRFGPLPLFRRRVRYADMTKVETGRTLLLDGWGIHYSVRGGWVWNLWGRDCVVVHLRHSVLRIGSDDAPGLARFLQDRIADETPSIAPAT